MNLFIIFGYHIAARQTHRYAILMLIFIVVAATGTTVPTARANLTDQ